MTTRPILVQTVLDSTDARGLADFYRQLLGLHWRPGDEVDDDWYVLLDDDGGRVLAVQQVDAASATPPTWPAPGVPQQMHLDMTVASTDELAEVHTFALSLGATVLRDLHDDPEEPIYVFADPAGHPLCVFVPVT